MNLAIGILQILCYYNKFKVPYDSSVSDGCLRVRSNVLMSPFITDPIGANSEFISKALI